MVENCTERVRNRVAELATFMTKEDWDLVQETWDTIEKMWPEMSRVVQKATGLIYAPITPQFPWLGLAAGIAYLPAKFKIRFLPPVVPMRAPSVTCATAFMRSPLSSTS